MAVLTVGAYLQYIETVFADHGYIFHRKISIFHNPYFDAYYDFFKLSVKQSAKHDPYINYLILELKYWISIAI